MQTKKRRLVVLSNRVPRQGILETANETSTQSVSGLVSGLYPALKNRESLWFGWSGQAVPCRENNSLQIIRINSVDVVTVDLSVNEVRDFYTEFCIRTLWPLFHSCFPDRLNICRKEFQQEYQAYRDINRYFATTLFPLLRQDDIVWIHDYQHIPVGMKLRRLGWTGSLGFFLHTPFPPIEILTSLPRAKELLQDLAAYQLLGFQTQLDRSNCAKAMGAEIGGTFDGQIYRNAESSVRFGVYPVGTEPHTFERWANSLEAVRRGEDLRKSVGGRWIVLGVDRLDHIKGILQRLQSFEYFLERYPLWLKSVSMVQITVPSRTHIPEYITLKQEIDRLVERINSRFSEDDWVPVIHQYRSYSQEELCAFYREADVCLITSLRDGMNLVAKEYIASQTYNPGVLILSRFCGAAEDLKEAITINPNDIDGTSEAIKDALEMLLSERQSRWQKMLEHVQTHTAEEWGDRFLTDLL
jgi:trehalose 6-phosphate synthase